MQLVASPRLRARSIASTVAPVITAADELRDMDVFVECMGTH